MELMMIYRDVMFDVWCLMFEAKNERLLVVLFSSALFSQQQLLKLRKMETDCAADARSVSVFAQDVVRWPSDWLLSVRHFLYKML